MAFLTILITICINSILVYADPTYRIAATGDISCSSNAQSTVNQIKNQNPDLVLWLGDLSYVDSNIDCFISQSSQLASKDEAVIGNHDDPEDGTAAARTQVINYFGLPSTGYYSKTIDVTGTQRTDDILLIGMDSQSSISSSSSQFAFVKNSLQNSNSPLKIVIIHKPFLSCSCTHSPNGQFNTYQPIFKQYGVDIVVQAHNHNIQYFNPIDNVKYIVSGAGGRSHYSLTSSPQPAHYRNSANYGFTLIDANFATNNLQGKFITNSGVDQTSSHFTQSFFTAPTQTPPVAGDQVISTSKNTAKSITLTATDANNDPLTYSVLTAPAHGTLSGTAPNLNYNPNTDYVGPDSFTFKANDGTADSNTATVSITVQDTTTCTTNLPISGVTASGNDGNVPVNVLDNNLNTRWSSNGVGQFITADLGSVKNICSVDIAWYKGNERKNHFVISTSIDGTTFTTKFSGDSSGTTLNSEKYTLTTAVDARYVRVTVNGNTANTWASITELDVFGASSNSAPVANNQDITTNKDAAKPITLTATDANNDPLTYSIVTHPLHGTISPTGPGGPSRTYTPAAGYVGSDSFTFKANDGTVDSNEATVSITVQDTGSGSCVTNLPVSGITASGNDGNVPANVLDNNLNTRWSSNGVGQFITADLGSVKNICSVDIAWYKGNERKNHFVISTSIDGTTGSFTQVFSGDSSGTTLNSEKYVFSATDARYVRVTVNGNTANSWASITELDIFGGTASNIDIFGIKKLYQTKSGGEEWYMKMNNPLSDSRFDPRNTITQNPDGSWKMKSTQVRMAVYTSTGFDPKDIPTLDHSVIASKGYMLRPNDWRNFEMTQYVKVNTSPSDDNLEPNGRGGRHTLIDTPPEGCEGSSMKGDVFFSGKVRFAKEQWHVSYVFTNIKTATGSIEDKWVGIKFVVYNFVENNKVVVKTELWLDTNNNGNFVKVDENVDRGGWGTEDTVCGGTPDQIISWGGPITTFRWDTATDVDFKNLSVREIVPPQ